MEGEGKSAGRGEHRALVDRVVQSETFRRSPRLRAFLLFVAEKTLGDAPADLTEYNIGRAVFERPLNFNPIEDSIVRSSARQLRIKLTEYFAGEGRRRPSYLRFRRVATRRSSDGVLRWKSQSHRSIGGSGGWPPGYW